MATGVVALPELKPERHLWRPVTICVAWELVMARIRVRPQLLQDAREHVLRCLPVGASVDEAERLACIYTHDFMARVRKHRYLRPALDPDIELAVPREWRHRLQDALEPVPRLVLQAHFGDGYPLAALAEERRIHPRALASAREAVRSTARMILGLEGMELGGWPERRVDLLIRRIAAQAEPRCPGPGGLLTPAGEEHAQSCPRCSRALRLIRWGVLSPNDLFLREGQVPIPPGRAALLALLLHPDGRRHRPALEAALGAEVIPAGRDAWLVPAADLGAISEALVACAEEGSPPRHLLRGAMVEGPARWSQGVLLGPLPVCALEAARARPWAEVDGAGELPAPLPPPPRAVGLWLAALGSGALAVAAGFWALSPPPPAPACPLTATFTPAPDGRSVSARFDTDDLAFIDVVALDGSGVRILEQGVQAGKGAWATGEGDFEVHLPAPRVAIVSSPQGTGPMLPMLQAALEGRHAPLEALASHLREQVPGVDVVLSPAPTATPALALPPMPGPGGEADPPDAI